MDLEIFTQKMESVIRRYRAIYNILAFMAVTAILFLIAVFFNMSDIFKMFSWTEPYFGLSPDIPLFTIHYETIFLFIITIALSLLIFFVAGRKEKQIYQLFKRAPPKRQSAQDIVEGTYPELKDRLKTAYDNRNTDNFIAVKLHSSVSSDVEGVASTDFIDIRRIAYSLSVIVVAGLLLGLIFFTGFTAPVSPMDPWDRNPDRPFEQPPIIDDGETPPAAPSVPMPPPPISSSPGIDIDITLPPGTGHGPGDMLEGTENEFTPSRPLPPESLSAHHFYDILPAGYEDLIREYFRRLAASS